MVHEAYQFLTKLIKKPDERFALEFKFKVINVRIIISVLLGRPRRRMRMTLKQVTFGGWVLRVLGEGQGGPRLVFFWWHWLKNKFLVESYECIIKFKSLPSVVEKALAAEIRKRAYLWLCQPAAGNQLQIEQISNLFHRGLFYAPNLLHPLKGSPTRLR